MNTILDLNNLEENLNSENNTTNPSGQPDISTYCKDWYMVGPRGQEVDIREIDASCCKSEREIKLAKVMETIKEITRRESESKNKSRLGLPVLY